MRIALLFLTLTCFVSAPSAEERPAPAAKGRLLAVGGGGTTDAIVARALELAGGKEKRVLIVPQASASADAGQSSAEFWREKGALDVQVLALDDREKALAAIRAADFVWMPGGDQSRLMAALREGGVLDAIRARYRDGALVGGTSAGAAVLSATMIIGGERADLTAVKAGGTEMEEGIGVWPNVLVDQHFLKRQRFNRLLSGVLDHPDLVGVGIDERTGVVLHPDGTCEVVGEGGVLIVDARRANRRTAAKGEVHSADALSMSIRRAGEKFTLALPETR
jgi:cyanophycinase